jgi:hypothetical protein
MSASAINMLDPTELVRRSRQQREAGGAELIGDGWTPLGVLIGHRDRLRRAAGRQHGEGDYCGPAREFATFHGDDPEQAAPVMERVRNQATIIERPATTAQPPSNEVARTIEMFRPKHKGSR